MPLVDKNRRSFNKLAKLRYTLQGQADIEQLYFISELGAMFHKLRLHYILFHTIERFISRFSMVEMYLGSMARSNDATQSRMKSDLPYAVRYATHYPRSFYPIYAAGGNESLASRRDSQVRPQVRCSTCTTHHVKMTAT